MGQFTSAVLYASWGSLKDEARIMGRLANSHVWEVMLRRLKQVWAGTVGASWTSLSLYVASPMVISMVASRYPDLLQVSSGLPK